MQIRKDLLNYNLTLKYIAKKYRVSITLVENEMLDIISGIPEHVVNLPKVISFDEFKADTTSGKYVFILNDPIHKKVLDILPNRKKEYLLQYFTYCNNRYSVEFVISDMYEPYLLVAKIMFPKAKYVVDRFHYITYIMDALDNIRIILQKLYGEKSKEYKLLKNKKNVSLLRKYSNGYTEGINNKIKVIKRIAFGYKNFELFRGRILYIFNGKISGVTKRRNDSKVKNK